MRHGDLLVCIILKLFCIYICALDRNFDSRKVIEQGLDLLLDSNGDGRLHSSEFVEFLTYFGPLESCMERVLPLFKPDFTGIHVMISHLAYFHSI